MTSRRRRLTDDEKAEVVRLRTDERLSSLEIAARLDSNTTTVCELVKPYPLDEDELRGRKAKVAAVMRANRAAAGKCVGGGEWTKWENQYLARAWHLRRKAAIVKALPGRSWAAIGKRAAEMGFKRSRSADSVTRKTTDPFFLALREVREARGMTREEVADKAGIHRMMLTRYERGEARPGWLMLRAWLGALQYDIQPYPLHTSLVSKGKKPWLVDEENILSDLLGQGSTIQEVALALKRPRAEVEKHALTLGLLESEATRSVSGMTRMRLG